MGSEVIIVPVLFGVIFGIFYLFIAARNKERLALIDKGADASIFYSKTKHLTPLWKVFVLNLAVLMIGVGLGIFLGAILEASNVDPEVAYPGTIFTMGGLGLLVGFFLTKKLQD